MSGKADKPDVIFRKVPLRTWNSKAFRSLSPIGKLLFFYCITSDQTLRTGLYELDVFAAARQIGTDDAPIRLELGALCRSLGWKFDPETSVLWVRQWFDLNPLANKRHLQGLLHDLKFVPATPLLEDFIRCGRAHVDKLFETGRLKDPKDSDDVLDGDGFENLARACAADADDDDPFGADDDESDDAVSDTVSATVSPMVRQTVSETVPDTVSPTVSDTVSGESRIRSPRRSPRRSPTRQKTEDRRQETEDGRPDGGHGGPPVGERAEQNPRQAENEHAEPPDSANASHRAASSGEALTGLALLEATRKLILAMPPTPKRERRQDRVQ
jgi:hypothetical protein